MRISILGGDGEVILVSEGDEMTITLRSVERETKASVTLDKEAANLLARALDVHTETVAALEIDE